MSHNYLIPLDHMESAKRIAEYLIKILRKNDRVTLYSVLPNPSIVYSVNNSAAIPVFVENQEIFTILENNKRNEISEIFETISKIITGSGVGSGNITEKMENQKDTIARHIIDEAEEGKYDVIIIGKHNSSIFSEIFLGSITNKVIHLSKGIPVTVI